MGTLNRTLWGALAMAVAVFAAGCSGSKCEGVTCSSSQTCSEDTGECVAVGLCAGVDCSKIPNTGCDPASGACKNLCTQIANAPKCTLPQVCVPTTGLCSDLCAGVACGDATTSCNPLNGKCEAKCKPATCTPEQTCEPTTGACSNKCETDKKPAGKPECASGLKCKKTTGECVTLCDGVTCPYAQWCDDSTGLCKGGVAPAGRPGAACTSAADCGITGSPEGQTFDCLTDFQGAITFPGGYCTATCSGTQACPQGSTCLGSLGCIDECTKDSDCRNAPQYRCLPLGQSKYGCFPAAQCTKADQTECAGVGGDCASDEDCISGATCETEMATDQQTGKTEYTGWDNGYCLWLKRKGDRCPAGSTSVPASQTDRNFEICLKDCPLEANAIGQGLGTPAGCGLGESCLQLDQNNPTAGVCYQESCDTNTDCQMAACTAATATDVCGKNQTCTNGFCKTADFCNTDAECPKLTETLNSKCDTVNHECFKTYCEPSLGQCLVDCTLVDALGDTDGTCAGVTCDTGSLCSKAAGGKCISAVCPSGTTCNAQTRQCDRTCRTDLNCGTNAVCEGGFCVATCTVHNEAKVCGASKVCGTNGHCQAKCAADADCGTEGLCNATTGRCTQKCNATVAPTACAATDLCGDDGRCTAKCTMANEGTVCGASKFCQTSTGKCLANCATDATICGAEKCSVDTATNTGYCGFECNTNSNCGVAPGGQTLTCQAVAGSNVKRCQ